MKKKEIFYTISDKIDTINDKLNNLADIVELIAEHESTDHISGSLWFIRDTMKDICTQIEEVGNIAMQEYIATQEYLKK